MERKKELAHILKERQYTIMKTLTLITLLSLTVALIQGRPSGKIEETLFSTLQRTGTANIIITFAEGTDQALLKIKSTRFSDRPSLLNSLNSELRAHASKVQVNIKKHLDSLGISFQSFWISNEIFVPNATLQLVQDLSLRDEVKTIKEEVVVQLEEFESENGPIIYEKEMESCGIQVIKAVEARDLLNSAAPSPHPVVVSLIDTGVRHTHEALRDNWVRDYGWFDPYEGTEAPSDPNGHGTHLAGTMAGKGGIGVYPEASWMACRGCGSASCRQSSLIACAQFITCPTLPDGSQADCSKAPNVVSNSWGASGGNTWFDAAIEAFHVAKIIPFFSIGNSGPSCGSVASPGDRDVIAVGAVSCTDTLSSFAAAGPTADGRLKPHVTAPAVNILSAYNTNDTAYIVLSGGSMACPHSAGLTAILFAYNPDLVYENVTKYMGSGADTATLVSNGRNCGGIPDDVFPNNHYGHGRINAFNSLSDLIAETKG